MNKNQQINNLKSRIHGNATQGRAFEERDIILAHHKLMKHYGWIPLHELRKLPMTTFFNLLSCCSDDEKREQDAIKKNNPKR